MRLQNHLSIIATTAALAAAAAPAAQASAIGEGGGDPVVPTQHVVAASSHPDSPDWALISLVGGGSVVLIGAGLGGSRRIARRRESAAQVQTPHVA